MLMLKDGITIIKGLCQQNEKNKSCFFNFTVWLEMHCGYQKDWTSEKFLLGGKTYTMFPFCIEQVLFAQQTRVLFW